MKKETVDLIKENIKIHSVVGEHKHISAHTHGATQLIGYELEVVLPLDQKLIMYILNSAVGDIYEGVLNVEFGKTIENAFLNCPMQFMECDFGEEDRTLRIILPDKDGKFPDTSTNNLYRNQASVNTVELGYRNSGVGDIDKE